MNLYYFKLQNKSAWSFFFLTKIIKNINLNKTLLFEKVKKLLRQINPAITMSKNENTSKNIAHVIST